MPSQFIPVIGLVVVTMTGGLALYYWRRSASLYALLVEGANRFEEVRQRSVALEAGIQRSDERLKQQRDLQLELSADLDAAREQAAQATQRLEMKEHEIRVVTEKLELQKGHLERQWLKAQEQLTRLDEERQALGAALEQARREAAAANQTTERELAALRAEHHLRERDWQSRLKEAERAREAAERHVAKVSEVKDKNADASAEVRRLKRKVAQYDRLYASMKGLREMSDERNRNWEVALRKLAGHVVGQHGASQHGISKADAAEAPLGPLVGKALQIVGAQLIDDGEGLVGADHYGDHDDEASAVAEPKAATVSPEER